MFYYILIQGFLQNFCFLSNIMAMNLSMIEIKDNYQYFKVTYKPYLICLQLQVMQQLNLILQKLNSFDYLNILFLKNLIIIFLNHPEQNSYFKSKEYQQVHQKLPNFYLDYYHLLIFISILLLVLKSIIGSSNLFMHIIDPMSTLLDLIYDN